jgi:4-carboxymuconolactone decarboxylase
MVQGGSDRLVFAALAAACTLGELAMGNNSSRPDGPASTEERRTLGRKLFETVNTYEMPAQDSPFRCSVPDFAFAEIWSRPGLDRCSRRWVTLASAGASSAHSAIRAHVRAALFSHDISLSEMQEFVLQFAIYGGWPKASVLEQLVREAASELPPAQAAAETVSLADPISPAARRSKGVEWYSHVMGIPPSPRDPLDLATLDYAFAEVWSRPGLDIRARRLITLGTVAAVGSAELMESHAYAAMRLGDMTRNELDEVVLQIAAYSGLAVAMSLRAAIDAAQARQGRAGDGTLDEMT